MSGSKIDTEWTDQPVCPWCGHPDADWWEHDLSDDGNTAELECLKCEKAYMAKVSIMTRFETAKIEPEQRRSWYFTFGIGQPHAGMYEVIEGTCDEARDEMFRRHGKQWAFQYKDAEAAGVERWSLKRLNHDEETQ